MVWQRSLACKRHGSLHGSRLVSCMYERSRIASYMSRACFRSHCSATRVDWHKHRALNLRRHLGHEDARAFWPWVSQLRWHGLPVAIPAVPPRQTCAEYHERFVSPTRVARLQRSCAFLAEKVSGSRSRHLLDLRFRASSHLRGCLQRIPTAAGEGDWR